MKNLDETMKLFVEHKPDFLDILGFEKCIFQNQECLRNQVYVLQIISSFHQDSSYFSNLIIAMLAFFVIVLLGA